MNFHKAAQDIHYTNKHVDILTQQIHAAQRMLLLPKKKQKLLVKSS